MAHFEKQLTEELRYGGKIFDVKSHQVELENGKTSQRDIVYHHGGVCVIAFDDDDNIFLVEQYRMPTGKAILELPAGKLEKGENPMEAAFRELEEETGYMTKTLSFVTEFYPTPAYCTEKITVFSTRNLLKTEQHLDENEFLDVVKVPFEKAVEMVYNNEIIDAKTQIGILMMYMQRQKANHND